MRHSSKLKPNLDAWFQVWEIHKTNMWQRNGTSLNSKNCICEMKVQLGGGCADRD